MLSAFLHTPELIVNFAAAVHVRKQIAQFTIGVCNEILADIEAIDDTSNAGGDVALCSPIKGLTSLHCFVTYKTRKYAGDWK